MAASRPDRIAREATDLLVSVLVAAFYLLFARGYRIYIGDQRQYFLQPFRDLSDEFIPRDWLTWDTTHYHYVFSRFVQVLDGVASTLGCSFETVVFAAYAVLLVFVFRGVLALVRALGGDRSRFLVVLFFVLCYGDKPSRGLAESFFLPSGYLVPSGIAAALLVYALAALFRSRWVAAWFLLGLSGMAHVNYGMAGAPFFAVFHLLLLGRRLTLREASVCAIAFAVPFSVTFVPTLAAFAGNTGGGEFAGLLRLAAPGHYAAATWSPPLVLAGFLPLVVGCVLAENRVCQRNVAAVFVDHEHAQGLVALEPL